MKNETHTGAALLQPRLVRVPWSAGEDESIKLDYAYANGAFNSYRVQAAELNRKFHGGKSVRSAAAVRNREGKLLSGSANDLAEARRNPAPLPEKTPPPLPPATGSSSSESP